MTNTRTDGYGPYADLLNDIAFQWVFGQEANKDLLIFLLNEFIPDRTVSDITLYKQRQVPFLKGLKKSVFDVSCRTDDGSYIDVEVQVKPQDWFADRCLYYSTFAIQGQIAEGADGYLLKPVYVISIDDFSRRHGPGWDGRVLSSYSLREDDNQELMTDNLHFVFVELSNFKKRWEDIDNDRERLYFCLKHLHEMDTLPEGFAEGVWSRLANQSKIVEMEPEVREQYISNMETEIDKRAQLLYARRRGHEEGLAEGEAKGKAEGKSEGLKEVAARMKSMGLPVDTICEATGLSPEVIEILS